MNNYTIENGKIKSKGGIPNLPRWYCDNLVAMENDKYGISKVEYFNRTTKGIPRVFFDDMWGGMKFFIKIHGSAYAENITDVSMSPYGFEGVWTVGSLKLEYCRRIINDTIVTSIKTGSFVPKNTKFSLEFYDSLCLRPQKWGDYRLVDKVERVWSDWLFDKDVLKTEFTEPENNASTYIAIGADFAMNYIKRPLGGKNVLQSEELEANREYSVYISFDDSEDKILKRLETTKQNKESYIEAQEKRYAAAAAKAPVLKSPYKLLNDFFALAPIYSESCKVQSLPGAIRAKTDCYWVWGWDGMSSCYAYSYFGDVEFVGKLLRLYMDTADENGGIAHNFNRDMTHLETSMYSAQGFYINLLYQYAINGGDIEPYYGFAKQLMNTILSHEVNELGLCDGLSLFPDFRESILETGDDISTFNNSSLYCGIAAMRYLAKQMDDEETYKTAQEFTERTRKNFDKILFDKKIGYYVSSADSKTLEKRNSYTSMAIKWDNGFCADLVSDKSGEALGFFEKNFINDAGILPLPEWGESYDFDSNQAHSWWPATSEYYGRLINNQNRKDLIDKFAGWIGYWTEKLMCPEGIDCYINTKTPDTDYWTTINGAWQAYSMRAWYEVIVHSIVGVEISWDGIDLHPYSGEEMAVFGLNYASRKLDIYMKGRGTKIKNVTVDEKKLGAVYKILKENLSEHSVIVVEREK